MKALKKRRNENDAQFATRAHDAEIAAQDRAEEWVVIVTYRTDGSDPRVVQEFARQHEADALQDARAWLQSQGCVQLYAPEELGECWQGSEPGVYAVEVA